MTIRCFLVAICSVWLVGASPAHALDLGTDSTQLSGEVAAVDLAGRTLELSDKLFHVPASVPGLDDLSVGDPVIVFYEDQGGQLVATELRIPPAN